MYRLHEQRQLAAEKQRLAEQQEEQRRLEEPIFQRPVSPVHPGDAPLSRADKIQKLRQEHQRRHRERQGQYPLDAEEERRIEELEIQVRRCQGVNRLEELEIQVRRCQGVNRLEELEIQVH